MDGHGRRDEEAQESNEGRENEGVTEQEEISDIVVEATLPAQLSEEQQS